MNVGASLQESAGNSTLFVGGLDDSVTEEQLQSMFALFGELVSVKLLRNKKCAFVQFSKIADAKTAMSMLQDQVGCNPFILALRGFKNS